MRRPARYCGMVPEPARVTGRWNLQLAVYPDQSVLCAAPVVAFRILAMVARLSWLSLGTGMARRGRARVVGVAATGTDKHGGVAGGIRYQSPAQSPIATLCAGGE